MDKAAEIGKLIDRAVATGDPEHALKWAQAANLLADALHTLAHIPRPKSPKRRR